MCLAALHRAGRVNFTASHTLLHDLFGLICAKIQAKTESLRSDPCDYINTTLGSPQTAVMCSLEELL